MVHLYSVALSVSVVWRNGVNHRLKLYPGLHAEEVPQTLQKFDLDLARETLYWIEQVLGEKLSPSSEEISDQLHVKAALRDGQALCRLINAIKPGAIKKINRSPLAFKEMENIEQFIIACKKIGMKEVDTFQTPDLYEAKSMYSVINCLQNLGSLAQKNGFSGPTIGVKHADENKRTFSEDQLAKGKTVTSLQYGSPLGASQKGMTPYGSVRKM